MNPNVYGILRIFNLFSDTVLSEIMNSYFNFTEKYEETFFDFLDDIIWVNKKIFKSFHSLILRRIKCTNIEEFPSLSYRIMTCLRIFTNDNFLVKINKCIISSEY